MLVNIISNNFINYNVNIIQFPKVYFTVHHCFEIWLITPCFSSANCLWNQFYPGYIMLGIISRLNCFCGIINLAALAHLTFSWFHSCLGWYHTLPMIHFLISWYNLEVLHAKSDLRWTLSKNNWSEPKSAMRHHLNTCEPWDQCLVHIMSMHFQYSE